MPEFKTIRTAREEEIFRVILARPEVHNAFNSTMISELNDVFKKLKGDPSVRIIILTGEGKSFCAGADLKWMKEIIHYSFEQNLEETRQLADLLKNIFSQPKPTIAQVNGAAIGGGNGLLCACDIALASDKAVFGLSEVKIGLVPAAISPYVIRKIGESKAMEYFLTGKRITAAKAAEIGLVNEVVPKNDLDEEIRKLTQLLLTSGPEAIAHCKKLVFNVPGMSLDEAKDYTAKMIANLRISKEGQEGMSSFLEKRKPKWTASITNEQNKDKDV
jgi:methylglutaconyl-CoA hydratase